MAGGGGGSNTIHALLSPDPETLPTGGVSRPATGEFLETKGLQGQLTVAPYAPLTAGPNSPLSQRYGSAIIPQELVAENGLFQPKQILEIGSAIPYAIHRESNGDSHALGSQRSPCHLAW